MASELLHVKVVAPTMLARAAVPGMIARARGTIINVAGMLAFGAPAPLGRALGRATYVSVLAHLVALSEELKEVGLQVQTLCPGIVATEFHERQGMDLSATPRMSAEDVVTASLRGLTLGEVVCAPGVSRLPCSARCSTPTLRRSTPSRHSLQTAIVRPERCGRTVYDPPKPGVSSARRFHWPASRPIAPATFRPSWRPMQ